MAEELVLEAGVPVMMVPRQANLPREVGRRILVAYGSNRESVRAVKDSLAFLQDADEVHLITHGTPETTGDLPIDQVRAYLTRHGVETKIDRNIGDMRDFGPAILATAQDMKADMIVMGASGRARSRNAGRVPSGHVFRHLTLPVLASH